MSRTSVSPNEVTHWATARISTTSSGTSTYRISSCLISMRSSTIGSTVTRSVGIAASFGSGESGAKVGDRHGHVLDRLATLDLLGGGKVSVVVAVRVAGLVAA